MNYRKIFNALIFSILIIAGVSAVLNQTWSNLFIIFLTILLSLVPLYLRNKFDIVLPVALRMSIVLFLFATMFLGEVQSFYEVYSWWDLALHFVAGFGLTIFGFAILKEIYSQSELKSTPAMTSFFALCFTAFVATTWEIYEFAMDSFKITRDMQPSNIDTMQDLITALIAAIIVCYFGHRYLRFNEKNVVSTMIEGTGVTKNENPDTLVSTKNNRRD